MDLMNLILEYGDTRADRAACMARIVKDRDDFGTGYWQDRYDEALARSIKLEFQINEELSEAQFFRYKGEVFDFGEFMAIDQRIAPHSQRAGWEQFDGYMSDSFYSGYLVRYVDYDHVIVAQFFC